MTDKAGDSPSCATNDLSALANHKPSGSTIKIDPDAICVDPDTGLMEPPVTGIAHEFQHAYDHKIGTFDGASNVWINVNGTQKFVYNKFSEYRAVNLENSVRISLGLEYRDSYGKYKLNLIPESFFRRRIKK